MKKVVFFLLLPLLTGAFWGCTKEVPINAVDSDGLSLYWDHEVFGEGGRKYRFEFYTKKASLDQYDLVFQHAISGNTITVRLVGAVSKGKCPTFPGTDPECMSKGGFYISEKELPPGAYAFNLITPTFNESARLLITAEKAVLDLSSTKQFTSSVAEVFPIPRNILFGSIVYTGSDKTQAARDMITYLSTLGVTAVTLPDYPYRHLSVSQASHLTTKDWPVDNHMIALLYSMNRSFKEISSELITSANRIDKGLTINLYTSLGDEAHLNSTETDIVYGSEN